MSKENNLNVKHYNLDEEGSQQDMANMVLSFAIASDTRINDVKNEELFDTCSEITKELELAINIQYKEMKKTMMINRTLDLIPIFDTDEIWDKYDYELSKIIDNIKFAKYEIKDIIKYLKYAKKNKFYDDMPVLCITILGLVRFHNDTVGYYKNKNDILTNELNCIGYIPPKKYELPDEDYKTVIDVAIDRLYGKSIQLFINEEGKVKRK